MSGVIIVRRNENAEQVACTTTTTGLDLFGDDRTVVAMRVDGETLDLQRELNDGDVVEPVLIDTEHGESGVGDLGVDDPRAINFRKITNPAQQTIGNSRRAA